MSAGRAYYRGTKILAIGKNYGLHKVEMGGTAEKLARPCFFLKPNSSVIAPGQAIVRPYDVTELHHEVELGVVIGKRCRHVSAGSWKDVVSGYLLGLDMTARDLQAEAKRTGMPWTHSKCYDTFTPLSEIIDAGEVADPHNLTLYLKVNGVEKQRGNTRDMLHSIPELIAFTSSVMTLEEGDVILTGTPAGVGPVVPGDTISCGIEGHIEVSYPVIQETLS